jgi:hypothetical protein
MGTMTSFWILWNEDTAVVSLNCLLNVDADLSPGQARDVVEDLFRRPERLLGAHGGALVAVDDAGRELCQREILSAAQRKMAVVLAV